MTSIKKAVASLALTGAVAASALLPFAASASTGYYGGYGYSNGGWGTSTYELGQLFVLGRLFAGPYGNGIISPVGTSLGDLFILDQLFHY